MPATYCNVVSQSLDNFACRHSVRIGNMLIDHWAEASISPRKRTFKWILQLCNYRKEKPFVLQQGYELCKIHISPYRDVEIVWWHKKSVWSTFSVRLESGNRVSRQVLMVFLETTTAFFHCCLLRSIRATIFAIVKLSVHGRFFDSRPKRLPIPVFTNPCQCFALAG